MNRKLLIRQIYDTLKSGIWISCMAVCAVMLMVSCSEGADCDETWSSDVRNAQLASPELTDECFSTVVNPDGTESVKVTWPIVNGAGGYEYKACIVDDPANPVVVAEGSGDRNFFSFEKLEDTKYQVEVRTLGNAASNNTEAKESTVYAYSTMVPGQIIPAGADIATFVQEHLLDVNTEQAFELEAGAKYTISTPIDFGKKQVTFRGSKVNRPIVTMDGDGALMTAGGLKVKFINFDCTTCTQKGIIQCSSVQYPELASDNFADCLPGKCYVLKQPIIIQECMFKNIPMGLFFTGENAWAVEDVRVLDCIVQLDNDGTKFGDAAILGTYSGTSYFEGGQSWFGLIRNVTIKNSTLYNLKDNSKNRVIRFLSNKMSRVYTTDTGSATIENCTFSKTFTDKEFANNTPNHAAYTITFNNNICYDTWRLQKFIQGNCTLNVNPSTNTIWGIKNPVDATDLTRCATEEDPLFEGDVLQPLDLTKPNGGVNFKAKGSISSGIGDPRWR